MSTSVSPATGQQQPSTWFMWHAGIFRPGARVLDLACGGGRHAVAAASRGGHVVAVDRNRERLAQAEQAAHDANVKVEWITADLERDALPGGSFDIVMAFNYLNRARMPEIIERVGPGGYLLLETFLQRQRELELGPTCDDHLLEPGEVYTLAEPLEIVLAREVLEVLDGRPRWVASVLARRVVQ